MGDALPRRVDGGIVFTPNPPAGDDRLRERYHMALEAITLLDGANQGIAMKDIAKRALDPKAVA